MTQEPNIELSREDLPEDDEESIWPRLLGEIERQVNGNEYTGRFTGVGRITSDYDEGSFLSDTSFNERHRSWRKWYKAKDPKQNILGSFTFCRFLNLSWSEPHRSRTCNRLIKSQLLCQLS